jgi:hypothetical protein
MTIHVDNSHNDKNIAQFHSDIERLLMDIQKK